MNNDIRYTKDELRAQVRRTEEECERIEREIRWSYGDIKSKERQLETLRNHESNLNKIIETLE